MPTSPVNPGVRQIIDTGERVGAVAAGPPSGSAGCAGTKWPLLPNQTLKIFNVSATLSPDADLKLIVYSMFIGLVPLDAQGNPITFAGGNIFLSLASWLADPPGGTAALPNLTADDGFVLQNNGDPLIELASNMLIANVAGHGPGIAQVQIQANADIFNTDSVSHNVDFSVYALLSFVDR